MSATTTYRLPSAEEYLWLEDLVSTTESRLGELHSLLTAPFDGDAETNAEPMTLAELGRALAFAHFLRDYANGFQTWAGKIEHAAIELRQIQEDEDGFLPDHERIADHWRRNARQWGDAAAEIAAFAEEGASNAR